MTDLLIIVLLALLALFGICSAAKHFKGRGGCCGGSGYTPKKKRLKHVLYTKTFSVEGMHCFNCKNRVEELVNDIPGAAGSVNLKKQRLTVSYEKSIDDALLISRIERAGYHITDIS